MENIRCDVSFHQLESPKTSQTRYLKQMVRIPREFPGLYRNWEFSTPKLRSIGKPSPNFTEVSRPRTLRNKNPRISPPGTQKKKSRAGLVDERNPLDDDPLTWHLTAKIKLPWNSHAVDGSEIRFLHETLIIKNGRFSISKTRLGPNRNSKHPFLGARMLVSGRIRAQQKWFRFSFGPAI